MGIRQISGASLLLKELLGQADVILVNSRFTAGVFREHFPSISRDPTVVYPGINFAAYEGALDDTDPDIRQVAS